jgi:hypothetical protein
VDYEIFRTRDGRRCIFTAVNGRGVSTVGAAEYIVRAISEIEGWPLEFYDLQTKKGYSYFDRGEYLLRRLVIEGGQNNPHVAEWVPVKPSQDILDIFAEHIGPDPRPFVYPQEKARIRQKPSPR